MLVQVRATRHQGGRGICGQQQQGEEAASATVCDAEEEGNQEVVPLEEDGVCCAAAEEDVVVESVGVAVVALALTRAARPVLIPQQEETSTRRS